MTAWGDQVCFVHDYLYLRRAIDNCEISFLKINKRWNSVLCNAMTTEITVGVIYLFMLKIENKIHRGPNQDCHKALSRGDIKSNEK